MRPIDLLQVQLALAFGALEMQRRMVEAAWQVVLWSMPGAALPGAGSGGRPAGRRKGRG